MKPFREVQIDFLVLFSAFLLLSLAHGQYWRVKNIPSNGLNDKPICFSCLGLSYKPKPFIEFWIAYPEEHLQAGEPVEHPVWVNRTLREKVVFIFLWQPGCRGCEEQWDDMVKKGLVADGEKEGRMKKYANKIKLFSLDASVEGRGKEAMHLYDPEGKLLGTPQTIVITLVRENAQVRVGWYSYKGKLSSSWVEEILKAAAQRYDKNRGLW